MEELIQKFNENDIRAVRSPLRVSGPDPQCEKRQVEKTVFLPLAVFIV